MNKMLLGEQHDVLFPQDIFPKNSFFLMPDTLPVPLKLKLNRTLTCIRLYTPKTED